MKNLRRMLCLLLVGLMLTSQALAVTVPGGGQNKYRAQGGASTDFSYYPYVGIALGIQQMSGYTVKPLTTEQEEERVGWRTQTEGLAEVERHFSYTYPQPYHYDAYTQASYYLLPKFSKTPEYATVTGGNTVGQVDLQEWDYADTYNSINPALADLIYARATASISGTNPYPNLTPEYFDGIINSIDEGAAKQLIGYIFGVTKPWDNGDSGRELNTEEIIERFNKAYDYGITAGMDPSARATRQICNYTAVLLSLAKCLPQANWPAYEKFISNFAVNALSCKEYTPIVITAELCMPFEQGGDTSFNTWRTVPEQIAIQTGATEANVRSTYGAAKSYYESGNSKSVNPTIQVMKAAYAEGNQNNASSLGGITMLGLTVKGADWLNEGARCRNMTSISGDQLAGLTEKWNMDVPTQGLWGCGIFGAEDMMAPPPPPHVEETRDDAGGSGDVEGTIGVAVTDPEYTKDVGAYSETPTVTMSINLDTEGYKLYLDSFKLVNGEVVDSSHMAEQSGAGIVSALRWMHSMKGKGYTVGDLQIHVWLAATDAHPALTSSAAKQLLDDSEGYYGDGIKPTPTIRHKEGWSPATGEPAVGANFVWNAVDLNGKASTALPKVDGMYTKPNGTGITIVFSNLKAAADYFEANNSTLTINIEVPINGTLDTEDSVNQHWFRSGSTVDMYSPKALNDLDSVVPSGGSLGSVPKYCYTTIAAKPEEKPFYYSTYKDPFAEFKQGTVPVTGGGSAEEFNSMTGTPTFTETSGRVDFNGTIYENAGHYYQYFASGGNEFVVQFDGKYMENQTATRKFTMNFSTVKCPNNTIAHKPAGAHVSGKPPTPCSGEHDCPHTTHYTCNPHSVTTNTVTFNVQYTGLCYIQITDVKVWKLSEARLDGTRELLDQNEVTASVMSTAPTLFYNIANRNDSASGRMVYDYLPNGAGAGGNADSLVWNFSTPSKCSGSFEADNLKKVQDIIKNSAATTCVSDFIVLRTTNGDQSILYHEYRAGEGTLIAASAITSPTTASTGTTAATITVTGGAKDTGVKFDHKSYDDLWKNNSQTSEGCGLPEDGITFGGYNGGYQNVSTKYQSTGHPSNINLESTTAYKNASGAFKPTAKPTQKFRLLNDRLVIPDSKQNVQYDFGKSYIFYENILNFGDKEPLYPILPQMKFGGRSGFVLETTYSDAHDSINGIVVYNPVSNQNAIVVSLPEERDQRVSTHIATPVDKTAGCPGDSSCPYLKNECTVTNHIHTEDCYNLISYEVHGPNNVHEHTDACTYHYSGPNTTGWRHIHCIGGCRDFEGYCTGNRATCGLCQGNVPFDNDTYPNDSQYQTGGGYYLWYHTSGCNYSGQTHTSTSSTTCTYCGHNCGYLAGNGGEKVYDCGNMPLNKHVCGGSGSSGGSITTGQSKDFNYTGNVQSITLDPGTYKLETWGAQGGSGSGTGGKGGYSTGTITLTTRTTLYVAVGGQGGTDRSTTNGGFNGGGYSVAYGSGGGGATHFATASGTLASLSGNKNSILIVAGGGGGEAGRSDRPGGAGGGLEGAAGYNGCGGQGYGGTQTAAGASGRNGSAAGFGYGGSQTAFGSNGGAGGGGGYYGGGAGGNDYSSYGDNDDSGGGGGSGYLSSSLTAASTTAGSRSGNGYARITAVSVTPTVTCYTMNKALLSCADPHHAYSYNWKIYTYGLQHTSGRICSGRSCTDTTALVFPTQEKYTVAQCAAGSIVRHANGNVHLTTTSGTCSYCGATYKEVLSAAQDVDRVPGSGEYSCYTYGDPRCWSPCGNNANHQKYVTEIKDNGTTYKMGGFINLDYPFTIYFPNTGDFYGTGAKWSSECSAERGWGYEDGMDTTEWIKSKWVEFPFAVLYNGQTYLEHERIYLNVPQKVFEFYLPLHDMEVANAEIKFGTVAINTQNGEVLECGKNRDHNIETIVYQGKPLAHHYSADKRTYIDVVGRIGNLALNDTGDFRFSNFFKQATSGWIVDNIVHTVDFTKQNNILLDKTDVRGVAIGSTGVAGNTHGTRPERGSIGKISSFPLSPATNNITALQKQPIRVGYDSYFDLTTLGNYYGNTFYGDDGTVAGKNLVLVKPHYYRLDLDTGNYQPVDVYMDVNGNKVLINDNDSNTVAYNGTNTQVNLNWVEEQARRNYTGSEVTNSKAVAAANSWVELPNSSTWVYGNYNLLNLTQRNRTFVGSEYTYTDKDGWVAHKDPSDRLPGTLAALQGARWHFNVGLPSSSVFVYSGQEASQANIDACTSGNAVIFCALEIYAQGEVWTLAYDGSNVNQPFTVTPGGKVYDLVIPYPAGKNPKGEEMPIVEIISINHSSKEDLNTAGTQ